MPGDDKKLLKSSLEGLSSVLREDLEEITIPPGGEPLWVSCSVIAKVMGISIASPKGTQDTLEDICSRSAIRYRKVILRDSWWEKDHGHLLAYTFEGEPLALIYSRNSGYVRVDPKTRKRTPLDGEIISDILPVAYMFYLTLPEEKIAFWSLFRFGLQKNQREYWLLGLSGVLAVLVGFFFPFANKVFFDRVIPTFSVPLYTQLVMGLFLATLSSSMFSFTRSLVLLRIQGIFKNRIQMSIWDRLLKLPVHFFRKFTSGDLLQRTMLLDQLQQYLNQATLGLLLNSAFSLLYLVAMFYYSSALSWVGLGVVSIGAIFSAIFFIMQVQYERERLESNAKIYGFLTQVMNGISKIRIAVAEHWVFSQWAAEYQHNQTLNLKIRMLGNAVQTISSALGIAGPILLFGWVIWDLQLGNEQEQAITIGSFLAFYAAYTPFSQAVFSIVGTLTHIAILKPYWERVQVILDEPIEKKEGQIDPGNLKGELRVENLSFRYDPNAPWVLRKVDLYAKPGEFIGIVGPSGSGKSTLCRLLIGFETFQEGAIYYDGFEIRGINPNKLRPQVGTLLQNSAIFAGTVLNNIMCGGQFTFEEIQEAMRISTFEEDLQELPMGVDTILPAGGGTLSGGQRQRLLLARALVRKPKIMILDEATSSLDEETQSRIVQNLDKLNVTRIVIAHRLSTLKDADRIYEISDGKMQLSEERSH